MYWYLLCSQYRVTRGINDQCIKKITPNLVHEVDDKMAIFSSTLLDIASDNIPKTSPFPKRKAKPWFDEDCQAAKKK